MTTHLLIGGTGKTGRRVAARLRDRGLPVRSFSRPEFDWADRSTWSAVEEPAAAAYLAYAPDITFPAAPEALREVAERIARSGVRRIVLVSGRGEPEAQRAERLVAEAAERHGAEWAVLRCAMFMQNFDESLFQPPLAAGHLAFVAGEVREPFVDAEDIADVAVGLMAGEVAPNRAYELTGPRLMTFAEATAEIAAAAGRQIGYQQVSGEVLAADLVRAGLPAEEAHELVQLFDHILDGHNASLATGVEEALGRAPRDFTEYAVQAAAAGAWSEAAAS
ncbi:NmrA family transcriptional regulator [Nocardioides antri]|uniref:NmrA family transcriptional regulator n=1 Tax=Nocardioides antri TaxID=2607659 RepID=A0A5B1M7J2_9ACTN|nr:NmrA family transcriptional regulator [Nocardioides antri]KAA1428486.1 NmrA family transcriptional regulator [Nocardioides antri]